MFPGGYHKLVGIFHYRPCGMTVHQTIFGQFYHVTVQGDLVEFAARSERFKRSFLPSTNLWNSQITEFLKNLVPSVQVAPNRFQCFLYSVREDVLLSAGWEWSKSSIVLLWVLLNSKLFQNGKPRTLQSTFTAKAKAMGMTWSLFQYYCNSRVIFRPYEHRLPGKEGTNKTWRNLNRQTFQRGVSEFKRAMSDLYRSSEEEMLPFKNLLLIAESNPSVPIINQFSLP